MKKQLLALAAIQIGIIVTTSQPLLAQQPVLSTPAATEAEKEAFYATTIENRVADILKALKLPPQ